MGNCLKTCYESVNEIGPNPDLLVLCVIRKNGEIFIHINML